ncbi:MAG: hypothetical protein ACYTEK_28485 [Planctomycetota bacterium]
MAPPSHDRFPWKLQLITAPAPSSKHSAPPCKPAWLAWKKQSRSVGRLRRLCRAPPHAPDQLSWKVQARNVGSPWKQEAPAPWPQPSKASPDRLPARFSRIVQSAMTISLRMSWMPAPSWLLPPLMVKPSSSVVLSTSCAVTTCRLLSRRESSL